MKRNGTRRLLAGLLAVVMVLVLLPVGAAKADAVVEIANYEQLVAFAARVNGGEVTLNAKLTEDIVCKNSPDDTDYANDWTPIGTYNKPYRGTFDGQGNKIIGLSNADVDYSGLSDRFVYIGLFGRSGGTVENVVLEDCDLSFASDADVYVYMGAVVGRNDGTVKACSVSGKLSAALTISSKAAGIGGVVGYNKNTVKTCTNSGAVSVSGNIPSICVGGVVGDSGGAEHHCANTGAVSGAGNVMVGGVVGYCNSVKNCFNTGAVSGDDGPTGGIVGSTSYRTVENCLNVGTVTGDSHTGGVIGQNNYGTVKTCLSVGAVSGSGRYIGGVVGMCPNNASVKSYVENCYCLDTSASAAIGDVGTAVVTSVSGLTAEQLKSIENCAGFSTEGGWYEGLYYPVQTYFAAAIHLYANSNEDLVIASYLPAFVPTKIANPFTYADHDFTGWNTDPDGDGDPYSEDSVFTLLPGETLTLYAQWRDSVVNYPLWVGGVQVTSANAEDVLDDGGSVKFEITEDGENVLTLTNASITGTYENLEKTYNLYSNDSEFALTIRLIGESSMSGAVYANHLFGMLQLTGDGKLTAEGSNCGISARGGITVDGPTVKATGKVFGVWTNQTLAVKAGSKLTAEAEQLAVFAQALTPGEGLAITTPAGGSFSGNTVYSSDGAAAATVVIEPGYTITFQNEDGTELQSYAVAAGETPVYEGDTPTKAPTVEHLYTFAGWKLSGTETVLTQLPEVTGEATYVAAYTESDRTYTGPVWAWDGYETATATFTATDDTTFTQVLTATGSAITHMTTIEPDCEYPGLETYTAKVTFLGKDYFNDKTKEIAKRDHIWVFDEFVWTPNEQGIYTVVANFHCERYASHTLEFIPVAGIATDPATCTEDGCTHYVAYIHPMESPDGLEHEDKLDIVIPAHGHQWSAPDYERIETETGYDVYAIVRCYYDYSHRIEETVHATYEVITPPTLEEEGLGRYTADFEDEHLWDIQWEVVIPKLALGLYGEDVDAFDVAERTEDGETLYRYDVMLRNDAEVLPITSVQMFVAYDDALTFVEAKTELHDAVIQDGNGVIALAWATDEGVEMENGTVVASLYFKLSGNVPNGGVLPFRFVEKNGNQSTVSYLANGAPVEAAAFETKDGSIVFAIPDAVTIAGEDVLSDDIYTIEDGKILYRYDIRVKDLPEAGLWINSAQIFVNFDHAVLAVAKIEGMADWTVSENGDKVMAVWASDTEMQISEDDVILTLWFEKIGAAPEDGRVPVEFTTNLLGSASAVSVSFSGTVEEIEAETVDGSITFTAIVLGDANCDGAITAADAALILRALVGLSELSPHGVLNADADGDGEITAADAALILRYVIGLIDAFPAEP